MHLLWFLLIVFIHSVLCINESDIQSDVQRRYSVNHPPSAEDYNPVTASVVYKDDATALKPHIPKYFDISLDKDIKQIVPTTEGIKLVAPKEIQESQPIDSKNKTESDTEDILVRPTARTLGEIQIPVAVIYDSLPDKTQTVDHEPTNIRRRKYKRLSRRKPVQNKTTADNENLTVQSTLEPEIENDDSLKSETSRTKPVQSQQNRTESTKPQVENNDSVKSYPQRMQPVTQQLRRTESAKPRRENDDLVKSETPSTKPDKTQLSTTESAKPLTYNDDSVKSETQKTKPVKQQPSRAESAKPQIENGDPVKSDTRSTQSVEPQLRRTKSAKPRRENDDSVKSETPRKPDKTQLSTTESVNPRRVVSARQSLPNIETTTKGEKTKRVRDPVVPIVEMENYVYAHNGNFHYRYDVSQFHENSDIK